jgi:integrase
MAKHENFTAGRIESFKFTPTKTGKSNQSVYWDGKTPGLGLRVTKAGTKTYIFEGWLNGRSLRMAIGDIRTWTVGKAQIEATRLKGLIDQGVDPRQVAVEKKHQVEAQAIERRRQDAVLCEVWTIYIKAREHAWSKRHKADHQKVIDPGRKKTEHQKPKRPGAMAALRDERLSAITPNRVSLWLKKETELRATQAALAFRLLRAFLNWCNDHPEYANLAAANACGKAAKEYLQKTQAKTDCLQREQLALWFSGVRQLGNPVVSAYLQGLLLTGARREELLTLQWTDVDFQWGSLTIRDKVEGTRIIPLTPYIANLLNALPRRNRWVFSTHRADSKTGHIADVRSPHVAVLNAAGLPHLSLHGLRRSFGTLSEWVEMPTGISAQIMGHKPSAIAEKHYRQRPIDLLRVWHSKIEAWILAEAGIEFKEVKSKLQVVKS